MTPSESETATIISRNFSLPAISSDMEDLHKTLSEAICHMLLHDYQKLLNLLYRIDVNEKKFQEAFKEGSSELVSGKISRLIIERELEKAIYREKYRNFNLDQWKVSI
jgi:hypothetical protein